MADQPNDAGLIQVLAERMKNKHLPRALSIKDKVDQGELLDEFDIHFLQEVFRDVQEIMPLVDRHPEWHDLAAKIFHLYKEITDKGLQNEQEKNNRDALY